MPLRQPDPLGREQVLKAAESPLTVHRRHGGAPEAGNDIGILSGNVWDCIATQNGTHLPQVFVAWVRLHDLIQLGLELRDGQAPEMESMYFNKSEEMRRISFYVFPVLLVLCISVFIIPDLSILCIYNFGFQGFSMYFLR